MNSSSERRRIKRFEVRPEQSHGFRLFMLKKERKGTSVWLPHLPTEEMYDALYAIHCHQTSHLGIKETFRMVSSKFSNISREVVSIFVLSCEICAQKRSRDAEKVVAHPIIEKKLFDRVQADLIDLKSRPDRGFNWVLVVQDHLTKFLCLRPLISKEAVNVASELFHIFCTFGAPSILQTDNGTEFKNQLLQQFQDIWPEIEIRHGRPRHPQSRGSIESANKTIKNMLTAWLKQHNSTHWSDGK